MALLLTLSMNFVMAEHDHSHAHKGHTKKEKVQKNKNAKKTFKATEDLSSRMKKIEAISKKIDAKNAKTSGKEITDVVNDIIKTCKLDQEADEAVHPILGKILEGANNLSEGKIKQGKLKIKNNLRRYKKLFKDA